MKRSHIIILVVLAVAFGVLLATVRDYSSYESFVKAGDNPKRAYHVVGEYVRDKGLDYDPGRDPNVFSFHMKDQEGTVSRVICNGDRPQDFELSEQIVVIGKMKADAFYADQLLTKCPSKYTDDDLKVRSSEGRDKG